MQAIPNLQSNSKVQLKRFDLNEQLRKVEASAKLQKQFHTVASFDWQFYLAYYEDLANLSSSEAACEHWQSCGKFEQRVLNETDLEYNFNVWQAQLPEDFDYGQYLALNQDLQTQLECHSYKEYRAIEHYVKHGKYEGRQYRLHSADVPKQHHSLKADDTTATVWFDVGAQIHQAQPAPDDPKLIAFYLPQFHPIPENDRWWGKGFTEWTNVSKAQPLFEGHYQPQLPADLGFYDLRLPEVRQEQAELARQYGIYGFCYYYYWFAGKKLLHRPLEDMLASGQPDFPFCICWANENWTRRWDGADHEVLIAQEYSEEQYQTFAAELVPILQDPRYIQVDGKPLIIVYRADIIPDVIKATEQWREVFRARGVGEVHLCIMLTAFSGLRSDPAALAALGFDSAVQFPPHGTTGAVIPPPTPIADFTGQFFDYQEVAINAVAEASPNFKTFPGVMPSFDNTPRRSKAAHAFLNSSPETYEFWLRGAIEKAKQSLVSSEQFVFINAWNEWAEGAHLEPDQKYGHAYLQATQRALHSTHSWRAILKLLRYLPLSNGHQITDLLEQLERRIDAVERTSRCTLAIVDSVLEHKQVRVVSVLCNSVSDILFSTDSPKLDALVSTKSIKIDGWVISSSNSVAAIEVKLNQTVLKRILIDTPRPDVACMYGFSHNIVGFCDSVEIPDIALRADVHLDLVLENGDARLMQVISLQPDQKSADYLSLLSEKRQQLQQAMARSLQNPLNQLKSFEGRNDQFLFVLSAVEKLLDEKEWYLRTICEFLQQNQISHFFEGF